MADNIVSLQLAGAVEVLNPTPSDPRKRVASLTSITNSPVYFIGFDNIYVEDENLHYSVVGGDAVTGWEFAEAGGGSASYINTADELTEAFEDPEVNLIVVGSDFQYGAANVALSGDKTVIGSQITFGGFSCDGNTASKVEFHNTLYIPDGVSAFISSTEALTVYIKYVDSGDGSSSLAAIGSTTVYYEKLYRGSNSSLAIATSGSISKKIWGNSAYNSMIARIETTDDFAFAMNDRSIHTLIIDAANGLVFNGGTFQFEIHPNKTIMGDEIIINGSTTWETTGGVDIRFLNEFYISPNATFTLDRQKSAKNFFAKIYGKTFSNTGFPNTVNGNFVMEHGSLIYEELSDAINLQTGASGSIFKDAWTPFNNSYETHVISEQDLVYALNSRYYNRIVVARPLTLTSTQAITLSTSKTILGESLILSDCSYTFNTSGGQLTVLCDLNPLGTASTFSSSTAFGGYYRLINNFGTELVIGTGRYEKKATGAVTQTLGGDVAIQEFWHNTAGGEVLSSTKTPTSSGQSGQQSWDGAYLYVCVSTDTWVRISPDTTW